MYIQTNHTIKNLYLFDINSGSVQDKQVMNADFSLKIQIGKK